MIYIRPHWSDTFGAVVLMTLVLVGCADLPTAPARGGTRLPSTAGVELREVTATQPALRRFAVFVPALPDLAAVQGTWRALDDSAPVSLGDPREADGVLRVFNSHEVAGEVRFGIASATTLGETPVFEFETPAAALSEGMAVELTVEVAGDEAGVEIVPTRLPRVRLMWGAGRWRVVALE